MPYPHDTDEWVKCAEDIGKTSAAHDNHPFIMGLLIAVMDELERAYKEDTKGRETLCE